IDDGSVGAASTQGPVGERSSRWRFSTFLPGFLFSRPPLFCPLLASSSILCSPRVLIYSVLSSRPLLFCPLLVSSSLLPSHHLSLRHSLPSSSLASSRCALFLSR